MIILNNSSPQNALHLQSDTKEENLPWPNNYLRKKCEGRVYGPFDRKQIDGRLRSVTLDHLQCQRRRSTMKLLFEALHVFCNTVSELKNIENFPFFFYTSIEWDPRHHNVDGLLFIEYSIFSHPHIHILYMTCQVNMHESE